MNIREYILSGVIESYVLGIADADEVAELLQLKLQYPEVAEAIASFEASLENAAFTNAIAPNTAVKLNLFAALENEFAPAFQQENNKVVATEINIKPLAPIVNINYKFKNIAVASVLLLIGSAALNLYFYNKADNAEQKLIAYINQNNTLQASNQTFKASLKDVYNNMALMSNPNVTKISLKGLPGKETSLATVFWDNTSKDVYLLANHLPETTSNTQYQLWAIVDGKPVDAGLVDNCTGLCKLKNISGKAVAFAITLEKRGGSPSPTLSQMYVLGKV